MATSPVIFRRGLDLKHEVAGVLAESYHSDLVDRIKADDYRFENGRLTVFLARVHHLSLSSGPPARG